MKLFILWMMILAPPASFGSTFVGNGGNAGDIELHISLRQIRDALSSLKKAEDPKEICTCIADLEDHPICDTLKALNKEQQKYCSQFMKDNSGQVLKYLDSIDRQKVQWTDEKLQVQELGKSLPVDAIANHSSQEIVIQRDKFLGLNVHEREYLLAHELFHLIETKEGFINDEQKIGPFSSPVGGRQLLNAAAASIVLTSYRENLFNKYGSKLWRSQKSKANWLSVEFGTSDQSEGDSKLSVEKFTMSTLSYRRDISDWGLVGRMRTATGDRSVLNHAKSSETSTAFGLGVSRRLHLSSDPLTFFGQSHFIFQALIERIQAQYQIHDQAISLSDSAEGWGGSLSCSYFMPIVKGFWVSLGLGYNQHNYEYSSLKPGFSLSEEKKQTMISLGANYGF